MSNSTSCSLCAAGKYNPEIGSTKMSSCRSCPKDTFSIQGATSCYPCPIGLRADPNSSSCIPTGNGLLNFLVLILLFLVGLVLYISYLIIYKRQDIERSYVSLHTAEPSGDKSDIEMTNNS